jgi:two-component system alkaline phosphatase synthesis response regulator PhoP
MAKKILVVDDEPDIRKLTSLRLKLSGYDALTAADGQEALDLIRQHKPDLVLLDLLLPVIGGSEVCKQIKEDEELKHTPVILFTARSDTMTAEKAKQLGADDYMTKPFDPEEMLNKIKQTLESKPTLPVPSKAEGSEAEGSTASN